MMIVMEYVYQYFDSPEISSVGKERRVINSEYDSNTERSGESVATINFIPCRTLRACRRYVILIPTGHSARWLELTERLCRIVMYFVVHMAEIPLPHRKKTQRRRFSSK